ncbi:hypothetical protein ACSBR2_010116 [Camellia fascicularis]
MEDEEEDERREAAIATRASLQPNFKPDGVSQSQLSKFQELHRRRLQIKAKSKIKKKATGNTTKDTFSQQQENVAVHIGTKKRQKLHWGLDTKERWERKANM